jgi:hypothetical protein
MIHLNSENYKTNFVGKVLICTRSKNIAKILLVPEFLVNFNPSKASLNL